MKFLIKLVMFVLILIWVGGVFIEFLLPHFTPAIYIYPVLKKSYSLVCHQETCKLITYEGFSTLVCSRCAGIYIGLLFASLFSFSLKMKNRMRIEILILAMLPILLDVIFYTLGLYNYSKTVAFLTGFLLGSVGFFYLYYGLESLIEELKISEKKN